MTEGCRQQISPNVCRSTCQVIELQHTKISVAKTEQNLQDIKAKQKPKTIQNVTLLSHLLCEINYHAANSLMRRGCESKSRRGGEGGSEREESLTLL